MVLYPRLLWAFLRFSSLVDASLSRIHVHASVGTYTACRFQSEQNPRLRVRWNLHSEATMLRDQPVTLCGSVAL
jgi:hypothetical protein